MNKSLAHPSSQFCRYVNPITLGAVLCSLATITGCSNPEVVQISPNTFMLSRADHGGIFGNRDALKASVIRDATKYAEQRGKIAVPLCAKEHPVGVLGDWASYELTFKIVERESPDAKASWVLVRSESAAVGGVTFSGGDDTLYVARNSRALTEASRPPAASSHEARSATERLSELKSLLEAKLITQDEYDSKRNTILREM